MDISLIPIWITSSFSAIGVVYAIVRNGSRGRKQDEELKTELKMEISSIKAKLDDPENGLSSIKKCVDGQKLHCAEISTRISNQVETNKEEIGNLRKK